MGSGDLQCKRERDERERLLDEAYRVCRRAAYRDFGSPKGAHWPQEPANQPFVRNWPTQRPAWWRPLPGLLEAVMAQPTRLPYGYHEPDWR